jgi:type I restriction enzyme S subunit
VVVTGGWKEVRLGDLGPLSKGVGIRKNEVTPYGVPCVRYGQIYTDYNFVIGEIQTFVSPQVAGNSRRLRKGEILFAGSGETKEDIGKCIAYVEDVGAVAGGDIIVLTPQGADSRFLGYSLNSPNVAQQKMSRAQGDAVVHISAANLASIVIDLPPLKEQEAIAEALSDADSAIESLDALIAKKRDVKQATMQQLLTGRTRLPGFTAEWIEVRLGDLLGYEQPTKYLVSSSDYVEGGQVPVLTAGKSFLLGYTDDNDGIYTNLPTIIFDDFTTATQWVDFEFKVKSSACKMLRPKNGACNPRYVFERLRALNYQTSDHKRHWISVFHSMEMMMPPLKEQEAIAEVLTVMDDELKALTEQVSKLRMVKEGMMQDLLTGKVRLV